MATFFLDDLNGSTIAGKSADVNFPTAQTWVNVDAELDGVGNLIPDGSVVDAAFGSATYGPATSTNVGVPLVVHAVYGSLFGADLRITFKTPAVVQDAASDQYIFQCGMYRDGSYIFGRAMLITGDAVGTVRVRVYTSTTYTDAIVTGVLPDTEYVAILSTVTNGVHGMRIFDTDISCTKTIANTNGVHRISAGAGLAGKVMSLRLTELQYSATVRLTAPSAMLSSAPAALANSGNANLAAPTPTLAAYGAGYAALIGPEIGFVSSVGGPGLVNLLTAPVGRLTGFGGVNAELTAPSASLAVAATFVGWGSAQLAPSVPALAATGKVSAVASAALTAPAGRAAGYFGSIISVSVSGSPAVAATGTTGALGRVALTAPLFDLAVRATAQNHGSAVIAAPVGRLATTGAAWLVAPGATLTAIGTAVVAVSYEAYALNLKHNPTPGVEPVDELTRYTNYPFDRIVRYKNSYFGMNGTGLYLLEGTTDFATPTPTEVPWSYKTALMDMKSVQLKNVSMAYFGGRMGPAATVSVYVGEASVAPYNYTTPRDATAQNYRQPLGKGLKSRYYAFGASGTGELTLDTLSLDVAVLARKV